MKQLPAWVKYAAQSVDDHLFHCSKSGTSPDVAACIAKCAPKVPALEWRQHDSSWISFTAFGPYQIINRKQGWVRLHSPDSESRAYRTLASAKEAARLDVQRRAWSCFGVNV